MVAALPPPLRGPQGAPRRAIACWVLGLVALSCVLEGCLCVGVFGVCLCLCLCGVFVFFCVFELVFVC